MDDTALWQRSTGGDGEATKDDGSSPDLVGAWATNGAEGYVRRSEWAAASPSPSGPAEAARWAALPVRTVSIPVYASDGTTVLGQFDLQVRGPD